MSDKIAGIENNQYKGKIQDAMVSQIQEWNRPVIALTLPAKSWHFEKKLLTAFPKAVIHGVECDSHIFSASYSNKPDNPNVTLSFGKIGDASMDSNANLVWFDFCGSPYGGEKWGLTRITEPASFIRKMVKNKKNAMVYITYCLISRLLTVSAMADKLWQGLSLEGAIKRKLWSEIGIKEGKGVNLVFEVKYAGGENESTPMLTLGFQIGKNPVKSVVDDWLTAVKMAHSPQTFKNHISDEEEKQISDIVEQAKHEWKIVCSEEEKLDILKKEAQAEKDRKTEEINAEFDRKNGEILNALRIVKVKKYHAIINQDDKDLIRLLHNKGLSNVSIEKASNLIPISQNTYWSLPYCSVPFPNIPNTYKRGIERRNVGATLAWNGRN